MEKSCGKFLWKNPAGNSCGKILWEYLVGKCCGKFLWENLVEQGGRGKSQFKKGSDWWKFSIWNRVMGSQPIRIHLGKILREIVVGKSCGKTLWEILVGKSCGKRLREILAGKSCRKCCMKSYIMNLEMLHNLMQESIRIQLGKILQENLAGILVGNLAEKSFRKSCGKSCGEILWEILAGNSCGKILWNKEDGEKANLRKAVIGGNLAFGIG